MDKIFTKSGDNGTTSLRGGERVYKDDLRIEVNGLIDLANSTLGLVRSGLAAGQNSKQGEDHSSEGEFVLALQKELMIIMSHVATPDNMDNPKELHSTLLTEEMEKRIEALPHPDGFIIPGENSLSSYIHIARSLVRRVEVKLWKLNKSHKVKREILIFFNRLSDYLFALAVKYSK